MSNQRDPFSQEAEAGVLGAMLIKPELIDILAADLKPEDFYYSKNREVFRSIMKLRSRNVGVDVVTVADEIGELDDEPALVYCVELNRNTPSVANANVYARIVLERSIDRSLMDAAGAIYDMAASAASTEEKISAAHAKVMAINSEASSPEVVTAGDALSSHVAELERREQLGGKLDGLSTGLKDLDDRLMGIREPQLVVVAGRPKMGKTTLAMNIADHNAVRCGRNVLVFSLEMSKPQLIDKSLSSLGGIPFKALKDGTAINSHSEQLASASNLISNSNLFLYDRRSVTINQIRAVARRHKLRYGLDLIIVDHIGLVGVEDARANSVQRVSEVTRGLKLMCMELGVPCIALSQLNRALEQRPNKRPVPSDLRDSGSIEQDADVILFVYRDEVYDENTPSRGVAELIIGAARECEVGTVQVRYQGNYSLFSDLNGYEPPPSMWAGSERRREPRSILD